MLLLLALACETAIKLDDTDTAISDSSVETGTDSGVETGTDSGDTSTDSGTDSGTDPLLYTRADGPYTVTAVEGDAGGNDIVWYIPEDRAGRVPLVLWSHGFARSPANHVAGPERLASWGFLVGVPDLPSFSDHEANAASLLNTFLPEGRATYADRLTGEEALIGHSAGGLASVLAAATAGASGSDEIAAVVGLDLTDNRDLGLDAARDVRAPTLLLVGEPSLCNADGNGRALDGALGGDHWMVSVTDATHCDFEDPTDTLCTIACGDADPSRQALVQVYAIAWLMESLYGPGVASGFIEGAEAEADRDAGRIDW